VFIVPIAFFIAAILLFAGFLTSSLVMAQPTTTVPGTTTTTIPLLPSPPPSSGTTTGLPTSSIPATPPLTPQEQEQLNRLQNVIAATNLNLDEAEKQIGGIVYTPRWSEPVWVEPDSAAVLVAYCLPGEFAESGQEILGGGFELEVLESYEVALPQNFMAWMMVIGNEDRQNRYPAAVGVICASDANDAETRTVSPEEQQQINNVISQITQVTSIDQVINIINNATTPTTPPPTTTTPQPGGGGGAGRSINASLSANPPIYNGSCPAFIEFSGTIYDNVGNRDVTYRFIRSDGAAGPEQVIHFNQPGSQMVSTSWTLGDINALPSYQGWVAIEILQPIQLQSNRAEFQMYCAPTTGGAPPGGSSSSGVGGITISDLHIDFLTASGPVASDTNTYNGPCPVGASISGRITDNVGNRDVTYRLIMNDGVLPEGVRHFDQPGSEIVSFGIQTLGGFNNVQSYQGWFAIEILQPVQLQSERVEFQTTCTPSTGGAPAAPQTLQAENDTTTAGTTTDDEEEPDTTTDGAGAGDTTGGSGGGTDDDAQSPPADDDNAAGAGDTTGGSGGGTDDDAEPQ
jgi:hypothetical protein